MNKVTICLLEIINKSLQDEVSNCNYPKAVGKADEKSCSVLEDLPGPCPKLDPLDSGGGSRREGGR